MKQSLRGGVASTSNRTGESYFGNSPRTIFFGCPKHIAKQWKKVLQLQRRDASLRVCAAAATLERVAPAVKLPALPFVRIADQEDMKLALMLNVIDPTIGGVLIMGDRGTGKSVAVRSPMLPSEPLTPHSMDKKITTPQVLFWGGISAKA